MGENIESIIERVLSAKSLAGALAGETYKSLLVKIHPDRCRDPRATDAMSALNALRDASENGVKAEDDAGPYRLWEKYADFPVNDAQRRSQRNWEALAGVRDPLRDVLMKYIGVSEIQSRSAGVFRRLEFRDRVVPLAGLTLPQVHVNWVLSRMLEFAAYCNKRGLVHGSLHPNSVLITPADHGIQVASMYTMTPIGERLAGASGKYLHWYPMESRRTKLATPDIDTEMCMRTAAVLLGDPSGNGVVLRKRPDVNKPLLEFIMTRHSDPNKAWLEYRELLRKEYKKEFIKLEI